MSDKIFFSESGKFICDENGYAYGFEPTKENQTELHDSIKLTLKHFIVPEGIVGFLGEFGRYINVKDRFVLPNTLRVIGRFIKDSCFEDQCVFANTRLPTVIIPDFVEFTGKFAFGDSEIDVLCLPNEYTKNAKEYVRAYKGLRVRKLYIHHTGIKTVLMMNDYSNSQSVDMNFVNGLRAESIYVYDDRKPGCLPTDAKQIR